MSEKTVDPLDGGRMLGAATAVLRSELTALPPSALAWHPAPGEWCTKDVLGHLIEAERRGFAGRIRIILEHDAVRAAERTGAGVPGARGEPFGDRAAERTGAGIPGARGEHPTEPTLAKWDPDAVARERRDCERDVAGLLDKFAALRKESVALANGLREAELGRAGQHPAVGRLTVRDLLHVRQILANVQAYVWPAMGNAQRFSRE